MAIAKYYFDFMKQNHEEIISRLLLVVQLDPMDDKMIVSAEQFCRLDQFSKDTLL